MDRRTVTTASEMIGQRLRREFYAEETSARVWSSLTKLSHAELDRQPWRHRFSPRRPFDVGRRWTTR